MTNLHLHLSSLWALACTVQKLSSCLSRVFSLRSPCRSSRDVCQVATKWDMPVEDRGVGGSCLRRPVVLWQANLGRCGSGKDLAFSVKREEEIIYKFSFSGRKMSFTVNQPNILNLISKGCWFVPLKTVLFRLAKQKRFSRRCAFDETVSRQAHFSSVSLVSTGLLARSDCLLLIFYS